MSVKDAVRIIGTAVRRLERSKDQGRVGRNNARAEVRRAVRVLLRVMDLDYPVIPKKRRERDPDRKPLTPLQRHVLRKKKLRLRGYVEVGFASGVVLAALRAGVRAVTIVFGGQASTWLPEWVVQIGPDISKLRRARKSAYERKALLAEAALSRSSNSEGPFVTP